MKALKALYMNRSTWKWLVWLQFKQQICSRHFEDPSGTGKLFFDFYRIMMTVKLHNKRRPVYWMYENVASMPQEYRDIITRFLGVSICQTGTSKAYTKYKKRIELF